MQTFFKAMRFRHSGHLALLALRALTACGHGTSNGDALTEAGAGGNAGLPPDATGGASGGAESTAPIGDAQGGASPGSDSPPSPFEGLWVSAKLPADLCEDYGTEPSSRFLRVRHNGKGVLEVVQLARRVPINELDDPGYEQCSAQLVVDADHAETAEAYFCASIARNPNGTASMQSVFVKVLTDELVLTDSTLHEHRVASDQYSTYDCPGVHDFSYVRSNADQSGQLSLTRTPSIAGAWRTTQGVTNSPGLYVDLDLEQVSLKVTGTFTITWQDSGTLNGVLTGTHLRGMMVENSGDPKPFDFAFSANGKRFVGTYGTIGVWNGAND